MWHENPQPLTVATVLSLRSDTSVLTGLSQPSGDESLRVFFISGSSLTSPQLCSLLVYLCIPSPCPGGSQTLQQFLHCYCLLWEQLWLTSCLPSTHKGPSRIWALGTTWPPSGASIISHRNRTLASVWYSLVGSVAVGMAWYIKAHLPWWWWGACSRP